MGMEGAPVSENYKRYIDQEIFWEMVSICAYYKFEKRDRIGGDELQDWLAAEAEISKQVSYWFQEC